MTSVESKTAVSKVLKWLSLVT